jgi:hypothetical protein
MILEVFTCQKWNEGTKTNRQIYMHGFHFVQPKNIKGWSRICTSYFAYSRFGQKIPKIDHHFFYILLGMIITMVGYITKLTKENN